MTPQRKKEVWVVSCVSVLTVCAILLTGAVARNFDTVSGPTAIVAGVVAFVWAATIAWAYMVLHEWNIGRHIITGSAVVTSLAMGLLSLAALVGGVIIAIFLSAAAQEISSATRERITFKLRHAIMPGIKHIVASVAVFMVIMLLPTVQQYTVNGGAQVSSQFVGFVLRPVAPILRSTLPGYTPESTVDELIDAQVQKQFESLPPGLSGQAPPHGQVISQLSQNFGVAVNGSDTVADVVARYVNGKIQDLADGNGLIVVIVLAAVGLLTTRAVVPLLAGVVFLLALVLHTVTKKAGLTTIIQTQVPVERLKI